MQLILLRPQIEDLDWDKKTDLPIFQKTAEYYVDSYLNYSQYN